MPSNSRVTQVVTQLEPAGAQSIAAWLEASGVVNSGTLFLYEKAQSDLFPDPKLLLETRPKNPAGALKMVRATSRWAKSCSEGEVLLAHTHYAIVFAALVGRLARKGVKTVAVHHWPEDRYPRGARAGVRLARRLGCFAAEIYCSAAVAPRGAKVIPNPVPNTDRALGGVADGHPVDILVVARHAEEKALDTALRALALLPDDRTITFVGGGPDTDELKALAKGLGVSDRAHFVGRMDNDAVRALMANCTAFLLPSRWEAMPVSLLEAVAMDADIVVSNIAAHDFLTDEGAAVAFEVDRAELLARALESLDATTRESLARRRVAVRSSLSEVAVARKWQSFLRDLDADERGCA